jgi:biopolymer transport protein ExbD
VPSDNEFYIGKSQIALSDIADRVRSLTSTEDPEQRIVFLKGEPGVHYSTLSQLIIQIKESGVSRIEVVPDRRKH